MLDGIAGKSWPTHSEERSRAAQDHLRGSSASAVLMNGFGAAGSGAEEPAISNCLQGPHLHRMSKRSAEIRQFSPIP